MINRLASHRILAATAGVCLVCLALGCYGPNPWAWSAAGVGLGYCGWRVRGARQPRTAQHSPPAAHPTPDRPAEPLEIDDLVAGMLSENRQALLLRHELAPHLEPAQFRQAWDALHESMTLVPEGAVVVGQCADERPDEDPIPGVAVRVEAFYLDRLAVTNRQYQQFVDAGGYEQLGLWDPEILPGLMDFVDQTGLPGPRFWSGGKFPSGLAEHPVVGVSCYEAAAYARWVGKRLPTDPEWEKAASWPAQLSASAWSQRRYPWGEVMDRGRTNLWGSSARSTVPVDQYPQGASVGGVLQLVGNVWEWTTGSYGAWHPARRERLTAVALVSIRGGAFDTYFDNQATCQFQSGENPLARKHNIGFRCALSVCDVDWQTATAVPELSGEDSPAGGEATSEKERPRPSPVAAEFPRDEFAVTAEALAAVARPLAGSRPPARSPDSPAPLAGALTAGEEHA